MSVSEWVTEYEVGECSLNARPIQFIFETPASDVNRSHSRLVARSHIGSWTWRKIKERSISTTNVPRDRHGTAEEIDEQDVESEVEPEPSSAIANKTVQSKPKGTS